MKNLLELPTEFYGCCWNEPHWEFDHPVIIYAPYKRYGFSNVEEMVEDICIDICIDDEVRKEFTECELKEFKWRRWNPKGFARRKNATHTKITVRWFYGQDDELMFEFINEEKSDGPFNQK